MPKDSTKLTIQEVIERGFDYCRKCGTKRQISQRQSTRGYMAACRKCFDSGFFIYAETLNEKRDNG